MSGHLLDAKNPAVNKIDIPGPQGAHDSVRMRDTERKLQG